MIRTAKQVGRYNLLNHICGPKERVSWVREHAAELLIFGIGGAYVAIVHGPGYITALLQL